MVEKMSHVKKTPTSKWSDNLEDARCPHRSIDLNREGVIVINISSFIILLAMISRWGEITLLVDSTNDLISNRCVKPGEIIHPPSCVWVFRSQHLTSPTHIYSIWECSLNPDQLNISQLRWASHNPDSTPKIPHPQPKCTRYFSDLLQCSEGDIDRS